jgi:serine/threonine protein phosphatase PrpC
MFCEECGHDLGGAWWESTGNGDRAGVCAACGSDDIGPEGYCEQCGQRRSAGPDHSELSMDAVAAVTDRGHRRRRNEDAIAIGERRGAVIAVVCDGVSTSSRADAAALAAVEAGIRALLDSVGPDGPAAATAAGARAAQEAVAAVADSGDRANAPSCTYVSVVLTDGKVTVGWVGDSRAYWLPDGAGSPDGASRDTEDTEDDIDSDFDGGDDTGPRCLTVDDSLAGRLAAAGAIDQQAVAALPAATRHLVRWLGADSADSNAHVVEFAPDRPGRVVACSDGLSRYRSAAAELAAATPGTDGPDGSPLGTARHLVQLALDAGGDDNIAVAVLRYQPRTTGGAHP